MMNKKQMSSTSSSVSWTRRPLSHDLPEQVVRRRLSAALLHFRIEIRIDGLARRFAVRCLPSMVSPGGRHDLVLHRQEDVQVGEGQTHQAQEHPARQGNSELSWRSHEPLAANSSTSP